MREKLIASISYRKTGVNSNKIKSGGPRKEFRLEQEQTLNRKVKRRYQSIGGIEEAARKFDII